MKIPNSWAGKNLELLLRKTIADIRDKKESVAKILGIHRIREVREDIADLTISEVMANEFSRMTRNEGVRKVSAALQAFQTYRLSLYDIRTDRHEYKLGKPTVLKRRGEDYIRFLEEEYGRAVLLLAQELQELGVSDGVRLAKRQYIETVRADVFRNRCKRSSIEEVINMNENRAGAHGKYISLLCGGGKQIQELAFSLANSMATTEDLIGLLKKEDFKDFKMTIPIAIFRNVNKTKDKTLCAEQIIRKTEIVRLTGDYVSNYLRRAGNILSAYDYKSAALTGIINDIDKFWMHLHRII